MIISHHAKFENHILASVVNSLDFPIDRIL